MSNKDVCSMTSSGARVGSDDGLSGEVSRRKPPPYHAFECLGERLVYDTSSCRFYRINEPTHRYLDLCRTCSIKEARAQLLTDGRFSSEVVDSVAREAALLAKHGLFDVPDYSITTKTLEQQLNERYSTSWTKLELALAETCNLACKYCYCGTCREIVPNQGLMSETVARQAITWLFAVSGRNKNVSITFFGGEPLLNKPVLRFAINYSQRLAKLHGKKVSYSMTTNGTLLDEEVIGYIKRYNFGLMVSLDGPPEIHDAQCPTRGGRGSFDMAAAGIKKLMARRRAVTVRCTMTHPVPRMLNLIKFFEAFGFTRIVLGRAVNPMHPSLADCTEDDLAECDRQEREELIPWMLEKLAAGETPKYFPYASFIAEQEKDTRTSEASPFKCGACRGTTTVGADGTLYPCHRYVGMQAWRIGNITDGPDEKRCKQFWRDYRASIDHHCESCWLWMQCKGPCPWEISRADGSFCKPHRHCDLVKRYAESAAYVYARKQMMKKCGRPSTAVNSKSSNVGDNAVGDRDVLNGYQWW
ncbi:MAG: radical SAM protein [Verrucomicrobia bacterium]|nr:radical SAM protein [Verrucomicrobiota bacterium]